MHVHRFLNLFRGCRALYDIYFSMLSGLLNHHSCYEYKYYTVGSRYNDILRHPKKYRYNEIIVITRIICIEDNTLFYYLIKSVMCF